jgi:Pyruvate/2-oxoacid:ferredoxin oxidoreductase delta subunit
MPTEALGQTIAGRSPAGQADAPRSCAVGGSRLRGPRPAHKSVAKIPPELRIHRLQYRKEPDLVRRTLLRLRHDSQFSRSAVQLAFVLLCVWIGIEFHAFVRWGTSGGATPYVERPPGVEGFLPISALISLKYWIQTGIVNEVHPSGLFILLAIVAVSLAVKKAFCGWLCPVGTLSEALWMLGRKVFGRTFTLPRWLDWPLRSLKYLLLLFFVNAVLGMDAGSLRAFIFSPYNKVADVKMYLFFAEITPFAFWTIAVLIGLSVLIKNFWCRYLCPYGALLGITGWLSPLKITRTAATCVDCELCTKACPSSITVHTTARVWSDECMSCMLCVEACPVKETLQMRASKRGRAVPARVLAALIAGVFVAVTGLAMVAGTWQNGITRGEYLRRMQQLDAPVYRHFRGEVPQYGPND